MKKQLFDQDRQFVEIIDNHESLSVNSEHEEIIVTGRPNIRFNGMSEQVKLVLKIERVEIKTIYHPLAPVNDRPSAGTCTRTDFPCECRRDDGKCTRDPIDNERCEHKDDEFEPVWMKGHEPMGE